MPAQIRCKICQVIYTSLDLDSAKSIIEVSKLIDAHLAKEHATDVKEYFQNYILPSLSVYQALAQKARFTELTGEEYNKSYKEGLKENYEKVVAVLEGNPERMQKNILKQ